MLLARRELEVVLLPFLVLPLDDDLMLLSDIGMLILASRRLEERCPVSPGVSASLASQFPRDWKTQYPSLLDLKLAAECPGSHREAIDEVTEPLGLASPALPCH